VIPAGEEETTGIGIFEARNERIRKLLREV